MNFIDIFDFSKYFKRDGDGKRAKIGHVNAIIEELYTELIVDISSSDFSTIGSPLLLLPSPGVNSYYEYEGILEVTIDPLVDTNTKTLSIIGVNSYAGTKFESLETYSGIGTAIYQFSSKSNNSSTNIDSSILNEDLVITNYEGGNWTNAVGTSGRVIIRYKIKTFGE